MSESAVLGAIRARLAKLPYLRLFRNNVGQLQDAQGRYVRYGLVKGSADLIGWTSVTITPAHLGKPVAIFTAVEVKDGPGLPTAEQANFINQVRLAGGIAGVARSPDEAAALITGGLTDVSTRSNTRGLDADCSSPR